LYLRPLFLLMSTFFLSLFHPCFHNVHQLVGPSKSILVLFLHVIIFLPLKVSKWLFGSEFLSFSAILHKEICLGSIWKIVHLREWGYRTIPFRWTIGSSSVTIENGWKWFRIVLYYRLCYCCCFWSGLCYRNIMQ
jgi:hypothetical protein